MKDSETDATPYAAPRYRKPGRWEGLIGGVMALITLGIQGTLLIGAIDHPSQPFRWLLWGGVLAALVVVDALIIRWVVRRRNSWTP